MWVQTIHLSSLLEFIIYLKGIVLWKWQVWRGLCQLPGCCTRISRLSQSPDFLKEKSLFSDWNLGFNPGRVVWHLFDIIHLGMASIRDSVNPGLNLRRKPRLKPGLFSAEVNIKSSRQKPRFQSFYKEIHLIEYSNIC